MAKMGTDGGSKRLAKAIDAAAGTKMTGVIDNSGFKVGSVIARDGRPGLTESHVEQTLDKGWALRPESTRADEVEKDQIGGAEWDPRAGGRETMLAAGTKEAGQLEKLI
jgi:hypothetical protein